MKNSPLTMISVRLTSARLLQSNRESILSRKNEKLNGGFRVSVQDKIIALFSLIVSYVYILASGNIEDSELNEKLIRRYGVPKSRTLTSSVFMSPIGQEHYELFEPLTGVFHESVQQAHGLREEGKKEEEEVEEEASTWCTRCVSEDTSKVNFASYFSSALFDLLNISD